MTTRFALASLAASALALAGCAEPIGPDPVDEPGVAVLERHSAEAPTGYIGFPVADSVRVRLVNGSGEPVAGAEVRFTVAGGGGSASPSLVTTSVDGYAATRWVLGGAEGQNRLDATASEAGAVSFTATARTLQPATISAVSGASTLVPVGCSVVEPLRAKVTGAGGQPLADAPVLYMVAGGAAADGEVVMTDAEGMASVGWTLRSGDERVIARIPTAATSEVGFSVTGVPVAPQGYATVGNRIVGPDCEEHRFVGVARPGLQWWPDEARLKDPTVAAAEFRAMVDWGANVVRIPLYQRFWLRDFSYEGTTYTKESYRGLIRAVVDRARAAGLAVILDLHNSDRGDDNFPNETFSIQQMADVKHSIPFWEEVAAAYKNEGDVLFQLYTEPNQISWEIWRDGGMIPAGETVPGSSESSGVAFEAAGMQDLYDAIRGVGANNLVIINGQHWGYDLSRVPEYAIDGFNIVYATHPYDWPDKQPEAWWDDFGKLSETHPVMIAEFGDYRCNSGGYYTKLLDFADQHGLSWIAWSWWAHPADQQDRVCTFPVLLTDWNFTPSPTGEVVRARMRSYR